MKETRAATLMRGRCGFVGAVVAVVIGLSFNWMAWVGSPTHTADGGLAVKLGQGTEPRPVSPAMWYCSLLITVSGVVSVFGFASLLVFCSCRAPEKASGRSYAKVIVIIFVSTVIVCLIGQVVRGLQSAIE